MLELARIVNSDCNCSFIVLATVITIINYDSKTFLVQATEAKTEPWPSSSQVSLQAIVAQL
jgi:hypothetical protein